MYIPVIRPLVTMRKAMTPVALAASMSTSHVLAHDRQVNAANRLRSVRRVRYLCAAVGVTYYLAPVGSPELPKLRYRMVESPCHNGWPIPA